MQEVKRVRIYGVKTIKGFHYIGKTEKTGNLCKSKICKHKQNIVDLFNENNVPELIELKLTDSNGFVFY